MDLPVVTGLVVDLFAGIGWGLGARSLGLHEVGIDLEPAVCATRAILGLPTIRADLSTYPPRGTYDGLIASPPCTDYSQAGKRAGRDGETGRLIDVVPRWVEKLMPRWVACEQVPDCRDIWDEHAWHYRAMGYKTWVGVLCAADYGVPQTRRRAFLLAHRDRQPHPPAPTHHRLGEGLFGGRPWVSMAEALGWDGECRKDMGAGMVERYGDRPTRDTDAPSFTVTGGSRGAGPRWVRTGNNSMVTGRTGSKAGDGDVQPYERSCAEPAPTLDTMVGGKWRILNTGRDWKPGGTREDAQCIALDQPAPGAVNSQWQWRRPATTVCADPRIGSPGHRDREGGEQQFANATRVSIPEALILQGFPPDTPLAGNKTQQWAIVGNAVPPTWAAHIISELAA